MANDIVISDWFGNQRTVAFKDIGGRLVQEALAGEDVRVFDGIESVTLTGVVKSLAVPALATHALIYAEGNTVNAIARYWQHATNPTSSTGKRLKDHEEMACASPATFRALNETDVITLRVEYYHYA